MVDGATVAQVGARAERMFHELETACGDVAVSALGRFLRVLAPRWIDLEPNAGRLLALVSATLSVRGYEQEWRALPTWNAGCPPWPA